MQAVAARDGKPTLIERPIPQPKAGELLVKVSGTAINRADLMQVSGNYPPPPGAPETLGLEFAGEVVEVNAPGNPFAPGARVMALVGGGGYAEYAVVRADHALLVPDNMSNPAAAATMEAFLTAYTNMFDMGRLVAGETVLIHAGASSVGLAATQMAKAIGARVIVTASAAKHDICTAHGADLCIDYKTQPFVDVVQHHDPDGVDLVLEMVGAPYWDGNMQLLKKWGRLVFIGLMGGNEHQIDFRTIMKKRLSIMGSTLRDRDDWRKSDLIRRFGEWGLPLLREGQLKATVWRTLPLSEVATAHDLMRNNANAGKIVLTNNT